LPEAKRMGAGESIQIGGIGSDLVVKSGQLGATGGFIVSSAGSAGEVGATGTSEMRLPQRVRARCTPSVRRVSPACIVTLFFVQKMRSPRR